MSESWFTLSPSDQAELLETAAYKSGRPPHLLEKDIWVVWVLNVLYNSPFKDSLTFKGGTSLSKIYKVIDRFSEDIDLTYDIRKLVPDLLQDGSPIPANNSRQQKISKAVRERLPKWITNSVKPLIENALKHDGIHADSSITEKAGDSLLISYPAIKTGTGYTASAVRLEFGARATGEPHQQYDVTCDIEPFIDDISFPSAHPLVMAAERTFWEKATAAHVYCLQGKLRGERYARHWYDLAKLAKTRYFDTAVKNRELAQQVARHKSLFFREKDVNNNNIDYFSAIQGELCLVPNGAALKALEKDYTAMLHDGLLAEDEPAFNALLESCREIQNKINDHLHTD